MSPLNAGHYMVGGDDISLFASIRDVSGGINTRSQGVLLADNQAESLENVNIEQTGKRLRRMGSVRIADDKGSDTVLALHNYTIQGATDQLLMYAGTALRKWSGSGNWVDIKTDFTGGATECGIVNGKSSSFTPDDIALVYNGVDNVFAVEEDGTTYDLADTNSSPPHTSVMLWYGNRFWSLLQDGLYYSGSYPAIDPGSGEYGDFDRTTNVYRIPVGAERKLLASRDFGIVVGGENAIWALNPSTVPSATDQPVPLVSDFGIVSKNACINGGDDIYFFSQDGLRSLKRNIQDKLQFGVSYPVSYNLKTEFDRIAWGYKDRIAMEHWDNKVFVSVPISETEFDVWIYYPATGGFTIIRNAWTPYVFSKYKVSGDERLYYGAYGDTVVYQAWEGFTDEGTTTTNGTAIEVTEIGRKTDFNQPLVTKVGGEIEIEAEQTDTSCTLDVFVKADSNNFSQVGSLVLTKDAVPTLPQTLNFTLAKGGKRRGKYKLSGVGKFRELQYKYTYDDTVASDIEVNTVNLITFPNEYQGE